MMKALSADQHDTVLADGLAVLVFRMAESPACQNFQPELDKFVARRPEVAVWTVEELDELAEADMDQEYNDWMVEMLETGEAGSPHVGSRR
jgi:hypothetical protein